MSTIWKSVNRLGYTYKVLHKIAAMRDEFERASFIQLISAVPVDSLIFFDESAVNDVRTSRNRGRALRGKAAHIRDQFGRGESFSMLAACNVHGFLVDSCYSIPQAQGVTGLTVREWVILYLLPQVQAGSVVVCDNAAVHLCFDLRELLAAKNAFLLLLPPYSPDLNPIEEGALTFFVSVRSYAYAVDMRSRGCWLCRLSRFQDVVAA